MSSRSQNIMRICGANTTTSRPSTSKGVGARETHMVGASSSRGPSRRMLEIAFNNLATTSRGNAVNQADVYSLDNETCAFSLASDEEGTFFGPALAAAHSPSPTVVRSPSPNTIRSTPTTVIRSPSPIVIHSLQPRPKSTTPTTVVNAPQPPQPAVTTPVVNESQRPLEVTPTGTTNRARRTTPLENTRKRLPRPVQHLNAVAKAALNAGIEHTTPRGVYRKQRVMKPPCKVTCNRCYKRRLTEEERENLFASFWGLDSINRKRDFLSRRIKTQTPATCSTLPEMARKTSRIYFFLIDEVEVRVCKTMFLNTLGVVNCWVETTLKKSPGGNGLEPCMRGKHHNRPKRWGVQIIESVRSHIASFPRIQSHYTRERTKREYLETGLSVQKMYQKYQVTCKALGRRRIASSRLYRRIFNQEYNLGFFLPKKDQCELCNRWKRAKNRTEREAMLEEYKQHLIEKKALRKLKMSDKASACKEKSVACFDLQKVLTCPRSETSCFYYRNKLSIFNFTVFELAFRIGHCYIWNETEGLKGANEVASNLLDFIGNKVTTDGCKEFIFYSDSPSGQNRNRMVFSMYLMACRKYNIKVTHRFLESGHSYSEVDSMHGRIEKEATLRDIFSESEWLDLIKNAKQEGEKYTIQEKKYQDFWDFHYLVDRQHWQRDTKKKIVRWSKVREVSCSFEHPNVINFKYGFYNQPSRAINIVLKKEHSDIDLVTYHPPKAYPKRFPLKETKKKTSDGDATNKQYQPPTIASTKTLSTSSKSELA